MMQNLNAVSIVRAILKLIGAHSERSDYASTVHLQLKSVRDKV
jgi:hypothetical protein